jgi:3-hydroxyisobutyrate dehydrogenase-like beta-hydroxyacid dehydrogenase
MAFNKGMVLARNFTTNFSVKWMHKDIGLMLESGEELGVPPTFDGSDPPTFSDRRRRRPW